MTNLPLVLIVDDEEFNRDYLSQEVEDLGCRIASAANGYQALALVENEMPDLVLLDIMMPELNGFSVLEKLKAGPQTRDIPVIIISAMNDISSMVRGIASGAEDYLPKPFNDVLLRARIHNSLQKRRWRVQEMAYLQQIEAEKQRADDLLHVILPDAVVQELKATDQVQPRTYPDVAVLFADIVDFTPYCNQHTPQEVISNLQSLVTICEDLALTHGLQKIKTVGDAFMAAGGLLVPIDNPVLASVRCGLDILNAAEEIPAGWQVRIGIHIGPVIAGLIGKRQYLYDIWGDTVNTAQRIESNGQPGAVNLSRAAWELVNRQYETCASGLVEVKGKGAMEIFSIKPCDG